MFLLAFKLLNGKLVVYLNAMAIVNEDTYGSFVRTVAQIIADNNDNVKRRRKKAKGIMQE